MTGGVAVGIDAFWALAAAAGVEEPPIVLGRPRPGAPAGERGVPGSEVALRSGGVDGVAGDAAPALVAALCTSVDHFAARRITDAGVERWCYVPGPSAVAGSVRGAGPAHAVSAVRGPHVDDPVAIGPAGSAAPELARFLGSGAAATCPRVRVPLAAISARLGDSTAARGPCAAAFVACGVEAAAAAAVESVLTTCTAWTEVVFVAREAGRERHSAAALVVYDSPFGRLLAVPGVAGDAAPGGCDGGVVWVTFGPAGTGRIARGLDALRGMRAHS